MTEEGGATRSAEPSSIAPATPTTLLPTWRVLWLVARLSLLRTWGRLGNVWRRRPRADGRSAPGRSAPGRSATGRKTVGGKMYVIVTDRGHCERKWL